MRRLEGSTARWLKHWLIVRVVLSTSLGAGRVVLVVDKIGIFRVLPVVLPFLLYHSTNTLYLPVLQGRLVVLNLVGLLLLLSNKSRTHASSFN